MYMISRLRPSLDSARPQDIPRMDAPRDHVHQLFRGSVSEDVEELDPTADYHLA